MDGDNEERRLVRYFYGYGYAPMRAPTSGSATERELPDVIVSKDAGGRMYFIELKTVKNGRAYVEPHEVEALVWFAEKFGGVALLCLRPGGDQTFFLDEPDQWDRTPSGNYSLAPPESAESFEGIVVPDPESGEIQYGHVGKAV